MMIDTHCHLDIDEYPNVELVINNMKDNIMIASGCNRKTNERVLELIEKYDNIYGTIGIHPEELQDMNEDNMKFLEENINNPKIVGIGEIGLDYYWTKDNIDIQKKYFIEQILLANKYKKPIVIHSREAAKDTYDILKTYLNGNKAVMHCYSYSLEMAKELLKLGLKFGIGGVLTFKNGVKIQEIVKVLPMESFLLETDSPYLTPEPYRGEKNEPRNIYYVAKKISEIKKITVDEVMNITTKNACLQFDLKL